LKSKPKNRHAVALARLARGKKKNYTAAYRIVLSERLAKARATRLQNLGQQTGGCGSIAA
jgi:hypothetical protein